MLANGVVPSRTTGLPIADLVVVKVGFDSATANAVLAEAASSELTHAPPVVDRTVLRATSWFEISCPAA